MHICSHTINHILLMSLKKYTGMLHFRKLTSTESLLYTANKSAAVHILVLNSTYSLCYTQRSSYWNYQTPPKGFCSPQPPPQGFPCASQNLLSMCDPTNIYISKKYPTALDRQRFGSYGRNQEFSDKLKYSGWK